MTKDLSPCSASILDHLPEKVTSWQIARGLFLMHPEYTHGLMKDKVTEIDAKFKGESKDKSFWIDEIAKRYPGQSMLHGRVVILGLYYADPDLAKVVPIDAISLIENELY